MRERWPRIFAAALFAFVMFAPSLAAQSGLGHLDDASLVPRGLLRLRGASVWTRYDSRFTENGTELLGSHLTTDSLGVAQLPPLASIQSIVQSASGIPVVLMLGRSRLDVTAREEIVPLGLEYGVTNRLSVNVVVPVVRRRVAALLQLDTAGMRCGSIQSPGGRGTRSRSICTVNVGPNPHRTFPTAASVNAQVQTQFATARTRLQNQLQSCQANPAGAGCPALLARQAEAQELLQSSQDFASAVLTLYGGAGTTGMAFVPTGQSPAQVAIAQRVATFNARYRDLLGTSENLLQAVPVAAGGPAGAANLQQYITGDLGRDSINFQERVGIGDVEVGFKMRVLDMPRGDARRVGLQLAVASSLRLPTGSRDSPSDLVDLRTSEGSFIADARVALDARAGRLGLLAVGQLATSVRDRDTTDADLRNSRWTEFHVAPRWHLSEPLALHAAYSLRSTDKFGGDQLLGGGVSFSTLTAYRPGNRTLPLEMRYTHLEAITGDAGRPKFFRDQIELRIYFRP